MQWLDAAAQDQADQSRTCPGRVALSVASTCEECHCHDPMVCAEYGLPQILQVCFTQGPLVKVGH